MFTEIILRIKSRFTRKWTVVRILYSFLGVAVFFQSLVSAEWIGVLIGGYIFSMGFFGFGCAGGGGCYGGYCESGKSTSKTSLESAQNKITYKEIK